jgi:hypothetical protein
MLSPCFGGAVFRWYIKAQIHINTSTARGDGAPRADLTATLQFPATVFAAREPFVSVGKPTPDNRCPWRGERLSRA